MIINSLIGGVSSAVDTHLTKYDATSNLTLAQFFSTFDVRFHYKNSVLFLYAYNNDRAIDGTTDGKIIILMIPNLDNFTNPSGYNAVDFYTNKEAFYWSILVGTGNKGTLTPSQFSVDSTTGRISCSSTATQYIAKTGSAVIVWEVPFSANYRSTAGIDTTPWGTT